MRSFAFFWSSFFVFLERVHKYPFENYPFLLLTTAAKRIVESTACALNCIHTMLRFVHGDRLHTEFRLQMCYLLTLLRFFRVFFFNFRLKTKEKIRKTPVKLTTRHKYEHWVDCFWSWVKQRTALSVHYGSHYGLYNIVWMFICLWWTARV